MSVRKLATAGVVAASWVVLGIASPAHAVCDAYSGGCPSTPPGTDIGGDTEDPGSGNEDPGSGNEDPGATGGGTSGGASGGVTGNSASNPTTLPFTGGELVLMTAIGAGALAGGTALVVAGRRRTHTPA